MIKCVVCQQNKGEKINTLGLIQPLNLPCQHWEKVSLDFTIGLPKFERKNIIIVVLIGCYMLIEMEKEIMTIK